MFVFIKISTNIEYVFINKGHNKNITALAISEDKKYIYTSSYDGQICILVWLSFNVLQYLLLELMKNTKK